MPKKATLALVRAAPRARTPKPIVIRQTKVVKSKHRRKHHRHSAAESLLGGNRGKILLGAFAVGWIQKSGLANALPKIPILGETGTLGLAAHFLAGGRPGLAEDIATAALTIAAFEFGSTGSVVGHEGAGAPMPDVSGYVAGF